MTTPGLNPKKSNSAANTIRKIFSSSSQRKVIGKKNVCFFNSIKFLFFLVNK